VAGQARRAFEYVRKSGEELFSVKAFFSEAAGGLAGFAKREMVTNKSYDLSGRLIDVVSRNRDSRGVFRQKFRLPSAMIEDDGSSGCQIIEKFVRTVRRQYRFGPNC
jgi:hypothetical protein